MQDAEFNSIEFTDFSGEDLYFLAPQKYRGNKLASYGGNLSFVIRYDGSALLDKPKKLDVKISVYLLSEQILSR